MKSIFTCKPETFKYKKTRQGIHATCRILDLQGNLVATLSDDPSAIVAKVDFEHEKSMREFIAEARMNLDAGSWAHNGERNDMIFASEYARQITMEAEDKQGK